GPDVPLPEQGCDETRFFGDASRLAFDDDPREPRMDRESEHALTERSEAAVASDGPEIGEQALGGFQRRGLGRREPGQAGDVTDAGRLQEQERLHQVETFDLRGFAFGARVEIAARVEAD